MPAENSENQHVVKPNVSPGQRFRLETLAEGVESKATLKLVEEYGVHHTQGLATGRPALLDVWTQIPGTQRRQAVTSSGA
jgi:EAL domain-containing protein (putative c-di-GMP-specific phosphodiesterase class I)